MVGVQTKTSWWSIPHIHLQIVVIYQKKRFKIDVIVEDKTNQHNFLIIGRHAEKILHVSCHTLVMQEGYEDPFVAPPILTNLVGQSKTFQVSFGNQNINFGKTDFIVHGLLEDKPLSKPANPSIKPQTPAPTAAKTIINQVTPAPLTPSQPLDNNPDQLQPLRLQKQRCSLINQTHLPDFQFLNNEMMRVFKVLLSLRIVLLQKARPICLGLEDFYIHQVYLRLQVLCSINNLKSVATTEFGYDWVK
ncbi:uncharacterized protein LOC108865975 isoform X2 [Pyrus x bretschneideri]|uniref:uncharacterized protein LOC108865975 isoform X2 n=1 Tax=Pyrus x bretschneideri TaxID=225117 RepID=UPI002030F70C|nr:uncharacterized protein LOC108865975 isoform X2 [Pyrus x bretschneideri]